MLLYIYCFRCCGLSYLFLQILLDPGIQSKLISFAGLLVANDCFFLHDIISYIIQPIIKVQMTHPHGELAKSVGLSGFDILVDNVLTLATGKYLTIKYVSQRHLSEEAPIVFCSRAQVLRGRVIFLLSFSLSLSCW